MYQYNIHRREAGSEIGAGELPKPTKVSVGKIGESHIWADCSCCMTRNAEIAGFISEGTRYALTIMPNGRMGHATFCAECWPDVLAVAEKSDTAEAGR